MGSPLSPIVANLYTKDFEKRVLLPSPCKPRLRVRYIDDVFAVRPHKDKFHLHLNKQHPSIQYAMEEEGNNQIAFLDVLMDRMDTTNTLASLFRKKMHTDHYLDFGSHHHPT